MKNSDDNPDDNLDDNPDCCPDGCVGDESDDNPDDKLVHFQELFSQTVLICHCQLSTGSHIGGDYLDGTLMASQMETHMTTR
jgi:hypothetical protein